MKIFALGEYHKVFTEMGMHWNGMYFAWKILGYDAETHDIRKENWETIYKSLTEAGDIDVLFIGLKEGTKFILQYSDYINKLRKEGTQVVFWFADLRGVEGIITTIPMKSPVVDPNEVGKLLDVIFVSNVGQLSAYKEAYGVPRVYYLPAACSEQYHYRNSDIKDKATIAFAGDLNYTFFHGERYKLLQTLKNKYDFIGGTWDRSDISTFYSSAKLALACDAVNGHPDLYPYLYSSDRFFISGGCGACVLVHHFGGIELLAEDRKHVVYFDSEEELHDLIDYYSKEDNLRNFIRGNAYKLFHAKHTHEHRIKNMMDIIEWKTEDFYGWL